VQNGDECCATERQVRARDKGTPCANLLSLE
jgi:hypothetical protein